jgi:hypothetical protein
LNHSYPRLAWGRYCLLAKSALLGTLSILGLLVSSAAVASNGWTAQFIAYEGFPPQTTYTDGQTYPTKAAAIAAMKALDPNTGERPYLTYETLYSQNSSSVTYKYTVSPVPLILAAPYYNWGGTGRPPNYSSESAATTAGFVQGLGSCAFTITPTGTWTNVSQLQPPYDDEDTRTYDETVTASSRPQDRPSLTAIPITKSVLSP